MCTHRACVRTALINEISTGTAPDVVPGVAAVASRRAIWARFRRSLVPLTAWDVAIQNVDLHEFRVSDVASAMRADRVFGVAREAALRECEPDVALALVAVGNGVVDWAVAFAAATRCEVAEAT